MVELPVAAEECPIDVIVIVFETARPLLINWLINKDAAAKDAAARLPQKLNGPSPTTSRGGPGRGAGTIALRKREGLAALDGARPLSL
ncbi:hypothetical protein THAOC_33912 [Thalassiosira oceanica]|uniref:Uncharacterized protein n=1 Tax=Thalassiosira oceanica TaxID=159749 RepID=K0RE83_THAOC|nr:hypothetical protein THAOC_33912 [Thalassiosira oceanica]|eukprot:EJK47371.1 hypothetical protein THAOC_33912 [Thalassiosira oceanica]